MQGLMQHSALTVDKVLDHAKAWHGKREVVSRSVEGPIVRITYAEIHTRAKKVSNALKSLGVEAGDRVATLAWNTARHIEAWYGIAGIGAIYHTLNPRLHPDQLAWIINHAEDKVIFTDLTFVDILQSILGKCPSVRHVVVMTDEAHMPRFKVDGVPAIGFQGSHCYEALIAPQPDKCFWGGFDEETACGLCYTSGTTGDPKGVLYSHRSNSLHTFMALQADTMGVSAKDTVLAIVPMFHANAWGLAFSAPAVGAKLVMPGQKLDGASVYELLDSEQVTVSAAVPTVWQGLLGHLRAHNLKLPHLKKVIIGGSACPEAIIRAFHEDYGVEVIHAWGMTETSPLGTLATMTPELADLPFEQQLPYRLKQGRPPYGVELKLVNDEGVRLPWDGTTFGRLMIKGAIVAKGYFKGAGGNILDEEGFFDTGDVATIDEMGFMQITDRAKDVIKSGGEWISSIDIENIAMGHPAVELAAVIGVAHPKWDERPLLLVKLREGASATKEDMIRWLEGKIAKWWMPDDVQFVDDIPLGATGKIDKKILRQRFADYVCPETPIAATLAPVAATIALSSERAPTLVAPEPAPEPEPEDAVVEPAAAPEAAAPEPVAPVAEPITDAVVEPVAAATEPQPGPPPAQPVLDAAEAAPKPETLAWAPAASPLGRGDAAPTPEPVAEPTPAPEPPKVSQIGLALAGLTAASAALGQAARARAEGPPVPPPTIFALEEKGHVAVMPPPPEAGSEALPEPLPSMPGATPIQPGDRAAPPRPVPAPVGVTPPTSVATADKGGRKSEAQKPEALTLATPSPPAGEPLTLAFSPTATSGKSTRAKAAAKPAAKAGKPSGAAGGYLNFAVVLAFMPALLVAAGAAATRLGLTPWELGFSAILERGPAPNMGWAPALAMVSLAVSLIGVFIALFAGWKTLGRRAMTALILSLLTVGAFAVLAANAARSPPIHEVATDWTEPLMFSEATLKVRRDAGAAVAIEPNPVLPVGSSNYAGRRLAEINAETCPGAQPLMIGLAPPQAFEAVRAVLASNGVTPTLEDAASGRLEGVATTLVYGFKDDVAVRVKPVAAGSRIDIRSVSRQALSDLGQNCRRVTNLLEALKG